MTKTEGAITRRYSAARERVHYALTKYVATSHRCEFVWILGETHRRQGDGRQAEIYFQRILDEHPDCERVEEVREHLRQGGVTRPPQGDVTGFL